VLGTALAVAINPKGRSAHQSLPVWGIGTALPAVLLIAAVLIAGIGVVTESLGGLYWLPAGLVLALLGGVLQAWVLLIEIRR
jgi:modulator of FtsH protease